MESATFLSDEWLAKACGNRQRRRKRRTHAPLFLPPTIRRRVAHLEKAQERMAHVLRREPTLEQLCQETGLAITEVECLLTIVRSPISLSNRSCECAAGSLSDQRTLTADEMTARVYQRDAVQRVLATLQHRDRTVLQYRYGLIDGYFYTTAEVALLFRTSSNRVRTIEAIALRRLHHPKRLRMLAGGCEEPPT